MPQCAVPGASIHYEQVGSGPEIVWVAGGGGLATDWVPYQLPFFKADFRNTIFDNRGIGKTTCDEPMPWPVERFARDTAALIEAVCEPPVSLVGISFGSAIVQQVAIDRPDLVRCAVVMGTGSRSTSWGWDYQKAEIDLRKAGGRLDGMFAVTHYAATLYPAKVLGDRELWPKLRDELAEWLASDANEESLIPQWESCLLYDQTELLPACMVPMHVIAFAEDVQAPPQDGEELAAVAGNGHYHEFAGMGHGSIYGHTHDEMNAFIRKTIEKYL
ncbi:MAG TPA: alpha/beta hydrolase [Actinomycetes bacterium]|nr:alpha/beta hydrolase [Actinomycetes bacterium]